MRDGTDMIIVTMSNDDTSDHSFFAFEIFDIRNDVIDTWHVFFWPLQTHVEDDDITLVLEDGHVATDFFVATQWNDQ